MCDLLTVFKNKFRKIENLAKKCVNLEGAIKLYIYIYIYEKKFRKLTTFNILS